MNKISKLTRMNIINLYKYGFDYTTFVIKIDYMEREYQESVTEKGIVFYNGRLDEIDFLKRIYDLEKLEGTDDRYDNVIQDIYQHRVRNWDWEDDWVFEYEPFALVSCEDTQFLKFVVETFDPYVRDESSPWPGLLERINSLLKEDGYELYVVKKISGNEVYGFKEVIRKGVTLEKEVYETLSNEFIEENIVKCNEKLTSGDYSGAITNARTLVEEILLTIEEKIGGVRKKNDGDINKMYSRVKKLMNFDPSNQDIEVPLKQIMTGLNSIVIGLGNLRSKAGDSHATNYKPDKHHAVLAVNVSFTFVDFILASYRYQVEKGHIIEEKTSDD